MSWLFSRALVAEYSAATCSDGVPSAPLSVMPTQHKFWRNDKTMEPCQLSRFGLTCAVLTGDLGADLLTWYLADSRVRTFPLLERVPELKAHALDYRHTWQESSARYDLDSCSWKTHRCLFSEDLPWSSVNLPRWGTILNGYVYQHPTAQRPISEIEYGLWPTPTTQSNVQIRGVGAALSHKHRGTTLAGAVVMNGAANGRLNPNWVEWLMGWPIGWTDLRPLEMDKFQEWRRQHLAS